MREEFRGRGGLLQGQHGRSRVDARTITCLPVLGRGARGGRPTGGACTGQGHADVHDLGTHWNLHLGTRVWTCALVQRDVLGGAVAKSVGVARHAEASAFGANAVSRGEADISIMSKVNITAGAMDLRDGKRTSTMFKDHRLSI